MGTSERGIRGEARTVAATAPRPAGALLVIAGCCHLLAPGALLWLAKVGYGRVLGVAFTPRDVATRRVRIVGVGLVAAGAHLLYHGGIRPGAERG